MPIPFNDMQRMKGVMVAALVAVSCGGGGAGPSTAPSPVPTGGTQPAVSGLFRACHRTIDGDIELVFLFENHDRDLIAGFDGDLTFGAQVLDPPIWKTTGKPPEVRPGVNALVKQVHVPVHEQIPEEITFRVWIYAAGDPAEQQAGGPDGLTGEQLVGPFGTLVVKGVRTEGTDLVIDAALTDQANLSGAVEWRGAHEATLQAGSSNLSFLVDPASGGVQEIRFPGAASLTGPVTLGVTSWQLLSTADHTSPVPSTACAR